MKDKLFTFFHLVEVLLLVGFIIIVVFYYIPCLPFGQAIVSSIRETADTPDKHILQSTARIVWNIIQMINRIIETVKIAVPTTVFDTYTISKFFPIVITVSGIFFGFTYSINLKLSKSDYSVVEIRKNKFVLSVSIIWSILTILISLIFLFFSLVTPAQMGTDIAKRSLVVFYYALIANILSLPAIIATIWVI